MTWSPVCRILCRRLSLSAVVLSRSSRRATAGLVPRAPVNVNSNSQIPGIHTSYYYADANAAYFSSRKVLEHSALVHRACPFELLSLLRMCCLLRFSVCLATSCSSYSGLGVRVWLEKKQNYQCVIPPHFSLGINVTSLSYPPPSAAPGLLVPITVFYPLEIESRALLNL